MSLPTIARVRSRTGVLVAAGAALLLVLLAATWFLLRRPPAVARTLPEADAIVYVDLRPVRLLIPLDQHPVSHTPDYQHFMDTTGIVPERDLRQAAFALHRMPDPRGPNGIVGYSEVFSGHFNPVRLTGFLRGVATAQETYAGHEIFSVPVSDGTPQATRTLRVTVLDGDTVAASNMPTPEQIHVMLDRQHTPALFRSGPLLLTSSYAELPVGAPAWGLGQLALPFAESGRVSALGLSLPIPAEQPILASLRYTTALHLRLELLTGAEQTATTQAEALRGMLDLLRALSLGNAAAVPPSMSELLRSVEIAPEHDRTVLRAVIPTALVREIAGSASDSPKP